MAIIHSHISEATFSTEEENKQLGTKRRLHWSYPRNTLMPSQTGPAAQGRASVTKAARKGLEIPSGGGKVSSERKASAAQHSVLQGPWSVIASVTAASSHAPLRSQTFSQGKETCRRATV